jgi:hypothetical protein
VKPSPRLVGQEHAEAPAAGREPPGPSAGVGLPHQAARLGVGPAVEKDDTIANGCRCAAYADADSCGCPTCPGRAAAIFRCPHRLGQVMSYPLGTHGLYDGLCDQCFEEARSVLDCGLRVAEHLPE